MRGHNPIIIDDFKGLWKRGNIDSCPPDHSSEATNCVFNSGSIHSRKYWAQYSPFISGSIPRRTFVYSNNDGKSYLIMITTAGYIVTQQILPSVAALVTHTLIGSTADIDVTTFGGRAYIATSLIQGYYGQTPLYVFDGTIFRQAGGDLPPTNAGVVGRNGAVPGIDVGYHYYGICFETDTGFITRSADVVLSPSNFNTAGQFADFSSIPIGPAGTVARRIVGTRTVPGSFLPSNGLAYFPSFFIPGGRIPNNTATTHTVNYSDSQLLDDATYLQDIIPRPTGGSCITTYHNRLVIGAVGQFPFNPHTVSISRIGDPETFEVADGTLQIDPSSNVLIQAINGESVMTGITEAQEYRDTLYLWKLGSTYGVVDNGDVPSTWPVTCIDQSNGSFRSGVVTVLDSGGINIEYIVVANKTGLYSFNGLYNYPEISWKIKDLWDTIQKVPATTHSASSSNAGMIHLVSDPVNKVLYCLLGTKTSVEPDQIFYCDFSETSITDSNYFMNVKWSYWDHIYGIQPSTLVGFDVGVGTIILSMHENGVLVQYGGPSPDRESAIPDDFTRISTYLIKDKEESKVIHFGGYTGRFLGNGVSDYIASAKLVQPGNTKLINLANVIIEPFYPKTKTVITNFLSQQAVLTIFARGSLNLDELQIWIKPTYKTIPT